MLHIWRLSDYVEQFPITLFEVVQSPNRDLRSNRVFLGGNLHGCMYLPVVLLLIVLPY